MYRPIYAWSKREIVPLRYTYAWSEREIDQMRAAAAAAAATQENYINRQAASALRASAARFGATRLDILLSRR